MPDEWHPRRVPRWIEIPAGIVLGLMALLCAVGAISMLLFTPSAKSPVVSIAAGLLILVFSSWCFVKTVRIVFGRPTHGGLFSPLGLRALGVLFLLLPLAGIFTGYYRERGAAAFFQAGTHVVIFFALQRLAKARQQRRTEPGRDLHAENTPL